MAPFSDPQMNQLMDQYFDHKSDRKFLYQGSQETIVKELKAWIVRRKEIYKEQLEMKDHSQKRILEMISSQAAAQEPGRLSTSLVKVNRGTALDKEYEKDSQRAAYLLDTLKSRNFTWPELWWRSESDGGVCSFLGTVDETFDARAELTILENKEGEERLRVDRAKIDPHVPAAWATVDAQFGRHVSEGGFRAMAYMFAAGKLGDGRVQGSQRNTPRQEKRAEDGKQAKVKAKDSKQTKG